MSEKVLTDDEMGALMDGVASGDVPVQGGAGVDHATVEPFEIGQDARVTVGSHPVLERLNEQVARQVQRWVRDELNWALDCDLKMQTVIRLNQLSTHVLGLNLVAALSLSPLTGPAAVIVDDRTLQACLERFFGASSVTTMGSTAETFTVGERRMGERLVGAIVTAMNSAWSTEIDLNATIDATHESLGRLDLGDGRDGAVLCEFQLEAEGFDGGFRLLLPRRTLGRFERTLEGTAESIDPSKNRNWRDTWVAHLLRTRVEVVATTEPFRVALRDVRDLSVGQTLPVSAPAKLTLASADAELLSGDFGTVDGTSVLRAHGWARLAH